MPESDKSKAYKIRMQLKSNKTRRGHILGVNKRAELERQQELMKHQTAETDRSIQATRSDGQETRDLITSTEARLLDAIQNPRKRASKNKATGNGEEITEGDHKNEAAKGKHKKPKQTEEQKAEKEAERQRKRKEAREVKEAKIAEKKTREANKAAEKEKREVKKAKLKEIREKKAAVNAELKAATAEGSTKKKRGADEQVETTEPQSQAPSSGVLGRMSQLFGGHRSEADA